MTEHETIPRNRRFEAAIPIAAAFATLVVFSALPYVNFYAANIGTVPSSARPIWYFQLTLLVAVFLLLLLKLALLRAPLWRLMLAVCALLYAVFAYGAVVRNLGLATPTPEQIVPMLCVWAVFALVASALVYSLAKQAAATWFVLALGTAFLVPSAWTIGSFQPKTVPPPASRLVEITDRKPTRTPNVYWIVLDGYPRHDVLKDLFALDNSRFLNRLRDLNFAVLDRSRANYPVTHYSVSATLNMEYLSLDPSTTTTDTVGILIPIMQGKNRTVATFKALGYRYVQFDAAVWNTKCAQDGEICVKGQPGLDELDIAILSNTPVLHALRLWPTTEHQGTTQPLLLRFAWIGVDGLRAKMSVVWEAPSPFLFYAHLIVPHPPMRFRKDCSRRDAHPDLNEWKQSEAPTFAEQVECTDAQTIRLMELIVERDPTAIVILQSDHGPAFRGQFNRPNESWDTEDLRERFAVLNAMRLPPDCAGIPADVTLINTFRIVLSCIAGKSVALQPDRFFLTPYTAKVIAEDVSTRMPP